MPWVPSDADEHNEGLTDEARRQWAAVANAVLAQCRNEGGADCEARAIKQANAAVAVKAVESGGREGSQGPQAVTLTEGGISYPAAAYAWTPDPDTPSSWRLRMRAGASITRGQLARAAAALSPGGFNGRRADIPAAALPGVRLRLREAYRSLDVAEHEMPRWVKGDDDMARTIMTEYTPLTEAPAVSKGRATVTIIRPGLNATGERYYPAATLARDHRVFEGAKMFADHPTRSEHDARPERSVRDWVGTLQNVRIGGDGAIIGEAVIVEPWMRDKLALMREQGLLGQMGISIWGVGLASPAEVEGVQTKLVERIVRARSVDFVTEPGAGGGVLIYESVPPDDIDLISWSDLRERRPDLVRQCEREIRIQLKEATMSEHDETTATVTQDEPMATQAQDREELQKKIAEMEVAIATLTQERDELQRKLADTEGAVGALTQAQQVSEAQAAIREAVRKAPLPEIARERLLQRFVEAKSVYGLADAIAAEADYVARLTEAGRPRAMGRSATPGETDALKRAFLAGGMTEAQAEIAARGR